MCIRDSIKAVLKDIGTLAGAGGILLYLDEIQYLNKKQQQSLLECKMCIRDRETKERRWFHNIAMGSEVEGRTKYILVLRCV